MYGKRTAEFGSHPSLFLCMPSDPDFCPLSPVSGNAGLDSACSALFLPAGIYLTQPSEGIECCQLFANVGPTPRNFTRGFTWQGTQVAADYHGQLHTCDHYTGGDPTALFESVLGNRRAHRAPCRFAQCDDRD